MMGLGSTCTITPVYSGRIWVEFQGTVTNSTNGNIAGFNFRYGTGTAPVNGSAPAGTIVGSTLQASVPTGGQLIPFKAGGIVTGLSAGAAVWLDLLLAASANTSTMTNISCSAFEF
jgi:hypothetical protein